MDKYLQNDPWTIIEESFHSNHQLDAELIFSLGNDQIIQFGNFEEYYSGETNHGSYIADNYLLKNTEISNPKPENSLNIERINALPNWIGIIVRLNDEKLDLSVWEVIDFKHVLNMKEGFLERSFEAISVHGHHIQVSVKRFLSMAETEVGAIYYSVKSLNFAGRISFMPIIDADLRDSNLNDHEPTWNVLQSKTQRDVSHLWTQTRRTDFHVCSALTYELYKNNELLNLIATKIEKEKVAGFSTGTDVKTGDTLYVIKYVAILNSLNHPMKELTELACTLARETKQKGWNKLFEEHATVWAEKWKHTITIDEGDIEDQRANRYELFRSYQGLK